MSAAIFTPTYTTVLELIVCGECSVPFGMTKEMRARCRADGLTFYCPNGHRRVYIETEADRLRAEVRRAEEIADARRAELDQAWAAVTETKKELTRTRRSLGQIKRRVHAGVCPHCHRTFENVARHMQSKHPGEVAADRPGTAPA